MTATNHSPNNRAGTFGAKRLMTLVSNRDVEILHSVAEFRLLSTEHLCQLHFAAHASHITGHRVCTRVLRRLATHRIIRPLKQQIGGVRGGSASLIWTLDVAGGRLLRHLGGADVGARSRVFEPSTAFAKHTLAVTDAALELVHAHRRGHIELISITSEPRNWRPFLSGIGTNRTLKPDLHVITASGDYEDHWFVEVDRATESIPVLVRKAEVYRDYWQTGTEQRKVGIFPRVLWLLPDERRVLRFQEALERNPRLVPQFFVVTTTDRLLAAICAPASEGDPAEPEPQGPVSERSQAGDRR